MKGVLKKLRKCSCVTKQCFLKIDNGIISRIIGCVAPALIPPIHIATLYYFWHQFSRRVDRRYCSCSCWDTVFKGTYESGIASYKHIYFNATLNTVKIWTLTVFSIIIFYESIRRLVSLGLQSNLRYSMLILFLSAIFSHYYSWWAYVNYWNDDYYAQWNHQLFFTSTELVSSFLVLQLADIKVPVTSRKVLSIVGIAILHVVAGSLDQFILNVIKGEGHMHQVDNTIFLLNLSMLNGIIVLRDLSFMVPDIFHVLLPLIELRRTFSKGINCSPITSFDLKKDLCIITSLISLGLILCMLL